MIENTHLELLISYKSSLPADCKLFAVLAWNANPWRKKHICIQHRKTWDRKCSQVALTFTAGTAETAWFGCNDFNANGKLQPYESSTRAQLLNFDIAYFKDYILINFMTVLMILYSGKVTWLWYKYSGVGVSWVICEEFE